ncbi:MAG: hypothetical protein J6T47_02465 [Lachnospiraceae bacterium]|nr:hypothetical protein [Lachnospiraceae bacterium]
MAAKRNHRWLAAIWLELCLLFVACKAEDPQQTSADQPVSNTGTSSSETNTLSPSLQDKKETSAENSSGFDISSSNTPSFAPEEDGKPYIIWATNIIPSIKPDAQKKIQQYIYDTGIDCKIHFISSYDTGEEYKSWVEELILNGNGPDILSSSYWKHGHFDAMDYVKENFLPLNDYLASKAGHPLWEAFSEVEWKRSSVNEMIYTIPYRNKSITIGNLYIYVNDQFKESFDRYFDGSYYSLKKILETHSNSKLHISLEGFSTTFISSFLDCQEINSVHYQQSTGELVDLTRLPETRKLLQALYEDCKDGIIRINITENDLSEDDLVWFSFDKADQPIAGYSEYLFSTSRFSIHVGGDFGILSSSPKKELALQILSACSSDPQIASLLYWGQEDRERWITYTNYLNSQPPDVLAGFIPELTKDQITALGDYKTDLMELASRLTVTISGGEIVLNTDFPEYLDRFFDAPHDYGNVITVMNDQLQDWLKSHPSIDFMPCL